MQALLAAAPWWVFSLLANVSIMFVEATYARSAGGTWALLVPRVALPIILSQYCLFRAFSGASHWFAAWAFFSVSNSLLRTASVYYTGHDVGNWSLVVAGIATMFGGTFLLKSGL